MKLMWPTAVQEAFDGRPFAQLLSEQGLQLGVRALLLYAVAMLGADQVGTVQSSGFREIWVVLERESTRRCCTPWYSWRGGPTGHWQIRI